MRARLIPAVILVVEMSVSALAQPPNTFTALSRQADAARDAERLQEAVLLYRKALALKPSWTEGWWSLATIEYDQNRYAEAARAFQRVAALAPANGTALAMLGLCEFELGKDNLALQHLERGKKLGVKSDPDLAKVVLYHEGVLLQRKGSFQAAQDTLEDVCLRGGEGNELSAALGMTMLRMADRTAPRAETNAGKVVLGVGRAECLAGQKKYDEARRAFEGLVRENPQFPNIHYAFGLFLMEIRDVPAGVEAFKREIANEPQHVLARLRIAASLYKEDSRAGLPYAEEAVKLAPQMGFAHYLYGLLLLDINDYERALPELETAQKSFPREAKLYFALGSAYSRAGRKAEAARARATFERLNRESSRATAAHEIGIRENPPDAPH
jgi:tetratricopeptide (TPR) repeat protein